MPAVSVLLPVRNGERFIVHAVESICAQTFLDWELIIINDNSVDSTPQLVTEMVLRDRRIRALENPSKGLVAALNAGISASHSDLLARMDADDIATPNRLARQVREFSIRPNLVALGGQIVRMDKEGRPFQPGRYPIGAEACRSHLPIAAALCHPAVMMRKKAVMKVGGYRPEFCHAEDYDLWLRLIEVGDIDNLAEEVLWYRVHDSGVTGTHGTEQAASSAFALLAYRARHQGRPEVLPGELVGSFEHRIAGLPTEERLFARLAYWRNLVLNGNLQDPARFRCFREALFQLTWAAARTADLRAYAYMMLRAGQSAIFTRHLFSAAEFLLLSFAAAPISSTRDLLARALR